MTEYTVHVTFQSPAYDERDGLDLSVVARTKADAIRAARRQMRDAGHCGRLFYRATEHSPRV